MSSLKLKLSVILKQVNTDCLFAIDCESEEDLFLKFENAAKFFIESLHEGATEEEIIERSLTKFSGVTREQIQKDFDEFVQTLEEFGLIQH